MLPEGLCLEDLEFVGRGGQGAVYRLDAARCIKVYHKVEFLACELEVLLKAAQEPQFPKVHSWGDDYMIREFIEGVDLKAYLRKHPWTEALSRQLAELLLAFERLEFNRLDTRMAHILVTADGQLKAIDPACAMRKFASYPAKLLSQMADRGCKKAFLNDLRQINPALHARWV